MVLKRESSLSKLTRLKLGLRNAHCSPSPFIKHNKHTYMEEFVLTQTSLFVEGGKKVTFGIECLKNRSKK